MKRYNLSKPRKYIDKHSGEERTYWDRVGEMVEFTRDDGSVSRIVKIPAIGLEANVFEDKPKEPILVRPTDHSEELRPEDVPFN